MKANAEAMKAEAIAMKVEAEAMKAEAEAVKANEMSLRMRIAYLARMRYGRRADRLAGKGPDNLPGLFDELFKEAMDEKATKIEAMAKGIGPISANAGHAQRGRRRVFRATGTLGLRNAQPS